MLDSRTPLEQFRTMVFADPALQQELRQTSDLATFVKLVLDRARERGCMLDVAEVDAALAAGARAWALRWVER